MADAAKPAAPEKKPIEEIIEKLDKKHKSYQNWIKTLETNHSTIYGNAIAKILGKGGKGPYDYSALDKDPKLRADLAKEIINQYMEFGKNTYGLDFSDDMMRAQGFYFLTKQTENTIRDQINDKKGNYTIDYHQKIMENHVNEMREVMQHKVTDHIEEGHTKDVLKHMGIDGLVDENLVKTNMHELRQTLYGHYLQKNEFARGFTEKYKKKEEKKAA